MGGGARRQGVSSWRIWLVRPVADYLALVGCALLVAAWYLPWYRMGAQVLRPVELPWGWAPPLGCAALALPLLLQPLAGWLRWLRPLLLLAGGLLLGLAVAALLVPLAFNALWWQVIGAPLDALAAELDGWTRLPLVGGQIAEWQAALRALPGRFLVQALVGPWLLAVGALGLGIGIYGTLVSRAATRALGPPAASPLPPPSRLALPGSTAPVPDVGPPCQGPLRPAPGNTLLASRADLPGNRCLGEPP